MTAKPEAKGLRMRGLDKTYNTLSGEEVEELKPVESVDYWSATFRRWVAARVLRLNDDGSVDLDVPVGGHQNTNRIGVQISNPGQEFDPADTGHPLIRQDHRHRIRVEDFHALLPRLLERHRGVQSHPLPHPASLWQLLAVPDEGSGSRELP